MASLSSGTKALATLGKNRKGHDCCFIFFMNGEIQNFERLSVFPECPIDFNDFSGTNMIDP